MPIPVSKCRLPVIFTAVVSGSGVAYAQTEPLTIVTAPAPLAWIVAGILALLLILMTGALLTVLKKSIGEEAKLQQTIKKSVEDSYARKIRNEYQAKQALLDKKLDQVRQRFSMVMMTV